VDGESSAIVASAQSGSSGQAGVVTVGATDTIALSNGGTLSIQNDSSVLESSSLTPTLLSVSARDITLKEAAITAASTGNVPASDIRISFADRLTLDPSRITTSASEGNGGSIRIDGGKVLVLDNSQITTSVSGASGNGGDISISAGALVMRTGFIQANTAGAGASGGNISIDVNTLVPSGNTLAVGGSTAAVFQPGVSGSNVIQAAAPTGVSGTIDVTTPALDVAGSLKGLSAGLIDSAIVSRDLCRVGAGSSLTPVGRGGLRSLASGMIRPEAPVGPSAHARVPPESDGLVQQRVAELQRR
jgi:hypothetical protein